MCERYGDVSAVMDEVKQKYASSKQQLLNLLTQAPKHWAVQRTADEFGVSKYVVNKACG
jgi:hypothetical protein